MTIQLFANLFQFAGSTLIAILCFKNYKTISLPIKILGYYSLSSILFQLGQYGSTYYFNNRGINRIGDWFVLSETILLSALFVVTFKNKTTTRIIIFTVIVYTIYFLGSQLLLNENIYSTIRFGRDLIMISLSIGYFFILIRTQPEKDLMKFSMFWINAGILFFFSGTFVLSLFVSYLGKTSPELVPPLWTFKNFFRVAYCLILSYAVLLDLKRTSNGANDF